MPERKIEYQPLDRRASTGFHVTAPSWQRLYIDAGLALTDTLVKLDRIKDQDRQVVVATGSNREELMLRWLSGLLALFSQDKFLAKRIVFDEFDGKSLSATLWGESYNPLRHGHVAESKALTSQQVEMGEKASPEAHFYAKVFLG